MDVKFVDEPDVNDSGDDYLNMPPFHFSYIV